MNQSSKWIKLIHVSAGICLNYAVKNTGIFNRFMDSLSSSLSADVQIILSGILTLAVIFVGYFLSSVLFSNLQLLNISQKLKKIIYIILPISYLFFALLTNLITGLDNRPYKLSKANIQQKSLHSINPNTLYESPVIAVTTLQDSEGFEEQDLTPENVKRLELLLINMIREDMSSKLREQGRDISQLRLTFNSKSELLEVEQKRLVVVRISAILDENTSKITRVIGFTQEGLLSVGCMRNGKKEIPIWSGVCGQEINKSFGFSIYQGLTDE